MYIYIYNNNNNNLGDGEREGGILYKYVYLGSVGWEIFNFLGGQALRPIREMKKKVNAIFFFPRWDFW